MKSPSQLQGRWSLVTGASSGLGADFAVDLAARGSNLILVARREPLLAEVAERVTQAHGVMVDTIVLDLGAPDAPQVLFDRVAALGRLVDVLVNNAGLGLYGSFLELPWAKERAMLELDVLTLVGLTKFFVRPMVARGWGRVLNIASIAAFQPSPLYAVYGAAKAFVLNFSEAINYELRGTGVTATTLSPGVTATEFLSVSGQQPTAYQKQAMMRSRDVVRIGVDAMLRGKPSVVPGTVNILGAWLGTHFPRSVAVPLAYRLMASNPSPHAEK